MVGKGVLKERLLQVVPPTIQVVLWRRVSRFKLQLRGRQETRRGRRGGGWQSRTNSVEVEPGCGSEFEDLRVAERAFEQGRSRDHTCTRFRASWC